MKKLALLIGLLLVISLPFLLREPGPSLTTSSDDVLIIMSGHNETVRSELGRGFPQWYRQKTGRTVHVDWRYLGGISEMIRYLEGAYSNAFRYHWTQELGRPWTAEINRLFAQRTADASRWDTAEKRDLYGVYYSSDVSSDVDLFFGGGIAEFVIQADLGNIVDSGFLSAHSEIFNEETIPAFFAGERIWDQQGRWFGQAMAMFGILYNADVLAAHGISESQMQQWSDLANPQLFGLLALADPTKSSALLKAFEMIFQQQMMFRQQELLAEYGLQQLSPPMEARAWREGWLAGLRLIQLISANTRYYAAAPNKMILDIAGGNSAAGINVTFLAQTQRATELSRSGYDRLKVVLPQNGSATSPDPIAVLRGAPHSELANYFLEYVLGEEGQKVLAFEPGTPGGPLRHALFRTPVNRKIFQEKYVPFRTSQENPYGEMAGFDYRPERTFPKFNAIRWTIKLAFIEPLNELVEAWKAILEARERGFQATADEALILLQDFAGFGYDEVNETLAPILQVKNPGESLRRQREIVLRFRDQYLRARKIAERR